eukprot:TRINITY_DN6768_c0_g1_i2.p1 TRINITY_DN6768_c0_g1~~TRINITY_DN6768_c0_g1_i2.p1  ORF type:complete len:601 (-),score=112.63 TRINITY_DN6768_c0_g1_i2:56-1831(-)
MNLGDEVERLLSPDIPDQFLSGNNTVQSVHQVLQLLPPQENAFRDTLRERVQAEAELAKRLQEASQLPFPNLALLMQGLGKSFEASSVAGNRYLESRKSLMDKTNERVLNSFQNSVDKKKKWQSATTKARDSNQLYEEFRHEFEKNFSSFEGSSLYQYQAKLVSCLLKEYDTYKNASHSVFDCLWMLDFNYLRMQDENLASFYNMCMTQYSEFSGVRETFSGPPQNVKPSKKDDIKKDDLKVTPVKLNWDNLIQIITQETVTDIIFQVSVAAPLEQNELFELMLKTLDYSGKAMSYISKSLAQEVANTNDKTTMFRGNTATTRIMTVLMKMVGQEFLENKLQPILDDVFKSPGGYEIDGNKATMTDDEKEANVKNLYKLCERFLDVIVDNLDEFPLTLRVVAYYVRKEVVTKFPEYYCIAVAGLLFLRFICPSISTPETLPTPLPEEVRRPLILASKTIQTLANGTNFHKKENHMEYLNTFIDKHKQRLAAFLDEFATLKEDALKMDPLCTHDEVTKNVFPRLYHFLIVHLEQIGNALIQRKQEDVLDKLVSAMGELGGIEGVEPIRSEPARRRLKKVASLRAKGSFGSDK